MKILCIESSADLGFVTSIFSDNPFTASQRIIQRFAVDMTKMFRQQTICEIRPMSSRQGSSSCWTCKLDMTSHSPAATSPSSDVRYEKIDGKIYETLQPKSNMAPSSPDHLPPLNHSFIIRISTILSLPINHHTWYIPSHLSGISPHPHPLSTISSPRDGGVRRYLLTTNYLHKYFYLTL